MLHSFPCSSIFPVYDHAVCPWCPSCIVEYNPHAHGIMHLLFQTLLRIIAAFLLLTRCLYVCYGVHTVYTHALLRTTYTSCYMLCLSRIVPSSSKSSIPTLPVLRQCTWQAAIHSVNWIRASFATRSLSEARQMGKEAAVCSAVLLTHLPMRRRRRKPYWVIDIQISTYRGASSVHRTSDPI
jgi:hypothetical protein